MEITNEIWKLKSVLILVFKNEKTKNGNRQLKIDKIGFWYVRIGR